MTVTLEFEKDLDTGRWYAVITEWEGDRDDLEMVCGADIMCDILAQGENNVTKTISTKDSTDDIIMLTKIVDTPDTGGALYRATWNQKLWKISTFEIWLCDVTKYIFGELPHSLYIK